jgi:hypothetical protein
MKPIDEFHAIAIGQGDIHENDADAIQLDRRLAAYRTQSLQPESSGSHPFNFIPLALRERIMDQFSAVSIGLDQ